jgi:hypothetical protein
MHKHVSCNCPLILKKILVKENLEYKTLKHLSENRSEFCIDISEIEINSEFLKTVIKDLKERNLIETEPYPTRLGNDPRWIEVIPSEKPEKCKIKLSGIEYLDTLEKSDTDFELAKRTLNKFPLTESRAKWAFFIGIGLAILELIKLAVQLLSPSGKT